MKSKILIFTDWFSPGFKAGGPIRSIENLINTLESVFEIYIITSDRDFKDLTPYETIEINTWIKYGNHSKIFYVSPDFYSYRNLKKVIKLVCPNAIYLNSMWSIRYTLIPIMITYRIDGMKIFLSPRGMLHKGALAFKKFKKFLFIYLIKLSGIYKRIIFHATDEQEKIDIKRFFPLNDIILASNIPTVSTKEHHSILKHKGELKLVFISRVSRKKNLLFLINILSNIQLKGLINLLVVGPIEDIAYIDECKKLSEKLPLNISVSFLEGIENRFISETIQNHHFFILPTLGENFGHAIFESFAVGRPVIISDQTPWKGLRTKEVGFDLRLGNPEDWIDSIQYCIDMNQEEFDRWCENAYQMAKDYTSNSGLKEKYIQLFSR